MKIYCHSPQQLYIGRTTMQVIFRSVTREHDPGSFEAYFTTLATTSICLNGSETFSATSPLSSCDKYAGQRILRCPASNIRRLLFTCVKVNGGQTEISHRNAKLLSILRLYRGQKKRRDSSKYAIGAHNHDSWKSFAMLK